MRTAAIKRIVKPAICLPIGERVKPFPCTIPSVSSAFFDGYKVVPSLAPEVMLEYAQPPCPVSLAPRASHQLMINLSAPLGAATMVPTHLILALALIVVLLLLYAIQRRNREIKLLKRRVSEIENHIRKSIESGISEAHEEAKRAREESEQKSIFLAKLSHEIRTPLNGIMGFTNLLADENLSPTNRKHYIDVIGSKGQVLLHIVNDIINISQIDANLMEIKDSTCNLNQLLRDLVSVFENHSKLKQYSNIELRLSFALNDSKCLIVTDSVRLEQILSNLIDNAIKFTDEGYIEIGYSLPATNHINFFVKDTGIGIPLPEHSKVFTQFYRGPKANDTLNYIGTGLGLSICKGLIELMKGTIGFESKPGEGSTFHFSLPFVPAKPNTTAYMPRASLAAKKPDFKGKVILVVEDDLISYQLIDVLLRETRVRLIHVKNGEDAIEVCNLVDTIDLVLMDMQLPFLDGYAATRRIKALRPDLTIIAQTAYVMNDDKQKCFQAGCSDYLPKPIDPDDLLLLVANHLSKSLPTQ